MSRKRGLSVAAAEAALVLVTLGLMFAAGFAGWAIGHVSRQGSSKTPAAASTASASSAAVAPAVAAGAHTFVQFACSQCHGPNGLGGVSPDVPALTSLGKTLTVAQLTNIIDHGLGLFTLSMHLSRIDVEEGQRVATGDRLGLSGATGRVTGPHLHWAVRWQDAWLDPAKLLRLDLSKVR